ncbi:MAG: type II toxin-antitoxin system RelE/ParE family toxin [Acidithiobacillus sp.]|jgi:plasmid maintenance system killer protein
MAWPHGLHYDLHITHASRRHDHGNGTLIHLVKGHFAVWVNGNWRLTFTFKDGDAILVDYVDYH